MQALAHVATLARLAAIAAVLALAGLLGVQPAVEGDRAGVRGMGPLPACRYDDILTSPRGYGSWSITLVDTILRVPKAYVPPDLVRVVDLGVPGRGKVRQVMTTDLQEMSQAAAAAGAAIGIQSAYRSYDEQQTVFAGWVAVDGYARALQLSARPGHSEHQLGLAIDVRSEPGGSPFVGDWGTTAAGKWMKAHAWEYGFVMSYPKGRIRTVCYDYEPWHFRYVGRELAAQIRASGLTLREYLWANFTTTVVPPPPPKPTARPAPAVTPRPSPTRTPAPTATVGPTPTATPIPTLATPPPSPSALIPLETPVTPAPTAAPPTEAPGSLPALAGSPAVLAGAGIAIGTIVMGVLLLVRRHGRSGVGL
jgi:LAS superfamily LD-carboxypeptidase LdcB